MTQPFLFAGLTALALAAAGCEPPSSQETLRSIGVALFRIEAKLDRLIRATEAPLVYITPEGRRIVLTPKADGTMTMTEESK